MVDMMPGETVEGAGAEGVQLAAPHHMNGCLTIPYFPSCHAPKDSALPGPPLLHSQFGSCRSAGAAPGEEGVACNGEANGQVPTSCWGGGFVGENFCVNGVVGGERKALTLAEEGSTSLTEPLLPAGRGRREPVEEEEVSDAGTYTTSLTTVASDTYSVEATTEATTSGSLDDHLRRTIGAAGSGVVEGGRTTAGAARSMVFESGRTFGEGGSSDEEEAGMFRRQRPEEASPAEAINLGRTRGRREEDRSSCGGSYASEEDSASESDDRSSHSEQEYMENASYVDCKSYFNLNKSSVHVGPTSIYAFKDATPTKLVPGVEVRQSPEGGQQERAAPALHISINTAPVQQPDLQSHSPLIQTYSAPVLSSKTAAAHRHAQMPPDALPATPTSAGATSINNCSSVHVGTQIIINDHRYKDHQHPLESLSKSETLLEKLLTEVREKLSTSYIRQTKTSFLPWLKGHQVIPMTEFYTESRILAVDKHGRPTHQQVNLVHDLVHEEETRFLVEGEPGMGKTLLAQKLAIDWANKKTLQQFKFVFLIILRDFKGSLEQYVREELLPSHFEDKFKQVWEYCKKNEEQVLFILDGYDELEKADEGEILKLLRNRDFQNSKVVVTARPDVLKIIAQRTIVKGFSEVQMFEFISKYFKLVNEDECGRNLKRIIEKDCKYRKLAKRPLFCVLLCMLCGSDGVVKLPEKLSDMMFKIMLCLIKWNIKKVGNVDENTEDFPPKFKELFLNFGKLCLEALMTEKTRFSAKKISGIENSNLLLHLGFLSNDSENDVLGHKTFWKPVHKIFLEYLAGLYMANHIERDKSNCKECREFSRVYRHEHVLKFVVGILGKRAHLALNGRKHQAFLQMKDQELLMLLRETESTEENCQAVAKLLDRRNAIVHTSEVDFEGWSLILDQKFQKLRSLEIVWRIKSNNPDQESTFSEASPELYTAFFNALKSNISITKISIRATQDGEPFSNEKIELFFSHLQEILPKKNLQELEIKELKMRVSYHLRKAIEGATRHMDKMALEALKVLRLDIDMQDEDLEVLCDRLKCCAPNLKELQLTGLVHGPAGFKSLVELLKKNKNLHQLCISMNKAQLMATSGVFLSEADFTPSDFHTRLVGMNRQANRNSKDAFKREKCDQKSQRGPTPQDPTQELKYLFQDHLRTGVKYSVGARNYCFIGDGEGRLPLPLCISRQHQSMFHRLFSALPESSVQSLTLDCPCFYLNTADLVCLGDAIRKAKNLTTLKLTDLKKVKSLSSSYELTVW